MLKSKNEVCIVSGDIQFNGIIVLTGILEVNNIKVKSGVSKINLDVPNFKEIRFKLNGNYCFKDVREIHIGKNTTVVEIKNSMFPNVNLITSETKKYKDGADMLIEEKDKVLLNSFYKDESYVLDMNGITYIAEYALSNCKAKKVINTDSIIRYSKNAFSGYKSCFIDSETNAKIFGNLIVDIDTSTDEIEIPDDKYETRCLCLNAIINKKEISVCKIHKYESLALLSSLEYINTLIIDISKNYEELNSYKLFVEYIHENSNFHILEVYNSDIFKIYEGILYSYDMKTLILCPQNIEGDICIPEGVEVINNKAFLCSNITSVRMPDSLKVIKQNAFKYSLLKNVTIGKNVTAIGDGAFSYCDDLENVTIPGNVLIIPRECFKASKIQNLTLSNGIIQIKECAFDDVEGDVCIPESVVDIERFNFNNTKNIYVDGELYSCILNAARRKFLYNPELLNITYKGHTVSLPRVSSDDISDIILSKSDLDNNLQNVQSEILCIYSTCNSVFQTTDIALTIYNKSKNEKAKQILKDNAFEYVQAIIQDLDKNPELHRKVIDVLKTDIINRNDLQKILELAEEKQLVTISAYVLDKVNKDAVAETDKYKL